MHLFVIFPDVERYKKLISDETESMSDARFEQLTFDGSPKIGDWTPPILRWMSGSDTEGSRRETYDHKHKIPDIAYWFPGCLVLSPKANTILEPLFNDEAEFLPVTVEGEKGWTILNVINTQDILDKANCRYQIHSDGTIGRRIIEAAFFMDKITNGKLFRIPGLRTKLCTSDTPNSFKEVVESHQLTGFKFLNINN